MADPIFENPKLAKLYDFFDSDEDKGDGVREDLVHYLAMAKEFKAKRILDVGCGTGCFAHLLNEKGFKVTGLDPALASLNVAREKPNSEGINWIHGDASSAPNGDFDIAFMTGNVAQVFITDEEWLKNLNHIKKSLTPEGHLIFEVRDPSMKDWKNWNKAQTFKEVLVPEIGKVTTWCEVTSEVDELVSFRWTYIFDKENETIVSGSTLRFRSREAITKSLEDSGFSVLDVRDAPDRPGKEFVFIAIDSSK